MKRLGDIRILMYSHDTFGLGHFRRCRAIAHAIVEQFKGVSVVIISGSQIAGAFDFRARVDFVKIPSVIKLYNGEYDSISDHISIDEILMMRKQIIQRTAEVFKPDIFITDKEPLGLRGELEPTLEMLSVTDTWVILGLRDVMDSPSAMQRDWDKDNTLEKITQFYDRVWIYGPESFWQPLAGLDVKEKLLNRLLYTGFLRRELSTMQQMELHHIPEKFILVTTGGGGDGNTLMEQVLAARELDISSDYPLLMVLGPFMKSEYRERIRLGASALPNITVLDFEARMELLLERATAVVGMCGYNTFCEVLSFDKKALFVPRTHPREEQYIRASRARELGLCEMLTPEEASIPKVLAQKLNNLPELENPSGALEKSYLGGLETICRDIESLINSKARLSTDKVQDHHVESTLN
jgi:predicted glycosyltransferase